MDTRTNPWQQPPGAIVAAGLEAIVRYYEAIERSGSRKSWTLKTVLVGGVCAGKSSVVKSLMAGEPRLVDPSERTRGVDVHVENSFKPDNSNPVELVFWDFAGHDDYHSTHSLFLTDGALFLLVVDLAGFVDDPSGSGRGDAIHIWLDALLCHTPGAVVKIVATHTDEMREDGDEEKAVRQLRKAVADHLAAKARQHESSWKISRKEEEMPAPATLKIVDKIHSVSCMPGGASSEMGSWPEFGEYLAKLAAESTMEDLLEPSTTSSAAAQRGEGRLFPSVGQTIPTIWGRAGALMEALRDGTDRDTAFRLLSTPSVVNPPVRYLSWEEAVRVWGDVVATSEFSKEIGSGGPTVDLEVCNSPLHAQVSKMPFACVPYIHAETCSEVQAQKWSLQTARVREKSYPIDGW